MPIYRSGTIKKEILSDVINYIDYTSDVNKNTLEKHLCLLFDAINLVPKTYYSENLSNVFNSLPDDFANRVEPFIHVERVFAYELYHRWSCLLCRNNDGFILNGEIGKYLKWFYCNGLNDNGIQKYPDILLHKGQTENNQMIVCEIKRMDRVKDGIVGDLAKLCRFTCQAKEGENEKFFTPYHLGVYLIINVEIKKENKKPESKNKKEWEDVLVEMINDVKNDDNNLSIVLKEDITKKIICVYSNWDENGNHSLNYQSLYNILRNEYKATQMTIVEDTIDDI